MNRRQQIIQQKYLNSESEIIRSLDELYKDSAAEVAESIRKKYKEIAELTDAIENLADDDPQKAVLESIRQSKVYQRNYQERLKKELDSIMDKMSKKEYTSISDYLNECYEDGFIGTLYDLHGQGVPFTIPMNQEAVVRAVQIDSKINVKLYERLKQDVDELKKKIASSVSNMLVTGKSYSQVSEEILRHSNIGRNRAIRIARTEGHRIQTTASMDALTSAKEIGADVVKQWDSTLDGKTRPSHIMTDGEIRELEEPFSNDLMFPGDPNGEAKEVVNCRCALLNRARWALEDGFTKMEGFTNEPIYFDSLEGYGYFKDLYHTKANTRYMEFVLEKEEKYRTKNFEKLLGAMSDREYKAFVELEKYSVNGIIQTGARIIDSYSEEAKAFARMYYDEIRSFSTDCKRIAKNLGKNESDIRKIKAYLFEDKSFYDEDEKAWKRFVPDCAIAQSWQRLIIGTDIKPHDITLIEHELYEMEIKKNNPGISHVKAHTFATKKYNYGRETSLYYGNLKKRNKNR